MRVLLDDQPCDVDGDSVAAALDQLAADVEASGRLIVEVVVDGTAWTQQQLSSETNLATSPDEIRLISAPRNELIRQVLSDATGELEVIQNDTQRAAESLERGDRADAMQSLIQSFERWQLVHQAAALCFQTADVTLAGLDVDGTPAAEHSANLAERLGTVRDALTAGDDVELSDILQYELPEVITGWRSVLNALDAHLTV